MNKLPGVFIILVLSVIVSSCIYDAECERFKFVNNSDLDLLLLFDYDTSDDAVSEGYLFDSVRGNNYMFIDTEIHNSWDKHIKDSLHLYIVLDTFDPWLWANEHIQSIEVFIDKYMTEEYIKDYLVARMTLKLEDVYPTTYPFKEVIFPPKGRDYNTEYYNGYNYLQSNSMQEKH